MDGYPVAPSRDAPVRIAEGEHTVFASYYRKANVVAASRNCDAIGNAYTMVLTFSAKAGDSLLVKADSTGMWIESASDSREIVRKSWPIVDPGKR